MNSSVTFAFVLIYFMMFCHQDAIGVPDTCGTQFYAQGVSKLYYGSSRSSAINWSRTIKTNTVDSTGTRTIIAFYCFSGSNSCEPDDTTIITSNGDMFVSMPGSNKLNFQLNVCWPLGTASRTGSVLTSYQYNSVIALLGQPFEVKVYQRFYVDTIGSDTSEQYSLLLSDSLGIVGDYDSDHRYYPILLLGAIKDGITYGVTTSVDFDSTDQVARSLAQLVNDTFRIPLWVTSRLECSVELYDARGQVLLRQSASTPLLDMSRFAPGVYFVVFTDQKKSDSTVITIFKN